MRARTPRLVTGKLRILITHRLYGSIDGIRLDRFQPGGVYEVGATIGSYLLAVRAGVPVDDDVPATAPAPERQLFGPVVKKGYTAVPLPRGQAGPVPREKAADRMRKKRNRKTKPRR